MTHKEVILAAVTPCFEPVSLLQYCMTMLANISPCTLTARLQVSVGSAPNYDPVQPTSLYRLRVGTDSESLLA